VAVDAVFDSVSVATTFRTSWPRLASSSAPSPRRCRNTPNWCASTSASSWCRLDNFYATLNSAVFTDGSFVYVPKGTRCPMELSTYFRINAQNTGQFERTLIVADEGSYVSATWKAAPRPSATRTSSTPQWWS
jgi:Fe-S cluster assembly protein SufB